MAQEKRISGMMKAGLLLGVCATLLLGAMSQTSYALLLNSTPDVYVDGIVVNYTKNNSPDNFSASGLAQKYNSNSIFGPKSYFDLFATISSSGLLGGGTLAIYDDNDSSNTFTSSGDHLYLSGNLTQLMFTAGDPVLNFLFTPTGGDYQGDYGALGGIILGASGFNLASNGFESDFGTVGATADVGTPVPEPSTVTLLLLGVGGLCFLRKRKS